MGGVSLSIFLCLVVDFRDFLAFSIMAPVTVRKILREFLSS